MPRIIPPGFAMCSIEHWLDNYPRPAIVTMGVSILGTESESGNVADQFHGAYTTSVGGVIDSSVRIRNARAVIGQDGGDPIVQESATSYPGARSGQSTPPALAVMASKATALGGRRNRGRMYIPWAVDEGQVGENGAIATAQVNGIQTRVNQLLVNLKGGDTGAYNLLNGAVLIHSEAVPPTIITAMQVNPTIRTQRRRQVRY